MEVELDVWFLATASVEEKNTLDWRMEKKSNWRAKANCQRTKSSLALARPYELLCLLTPSCQNVVSVPNPRRFLQRSRITLFPIVLGFKIQWNRILPIKLLGPGWCQWVWSLTLVFSSFFFFFNSFLLCLYYTLLFFIFLFLKKKFCVLWTSYPLFIFFNEKIIHIYF